MRKKNVLIIFLLGIMNIYAQLGINVYKPLGVLHVDGKKDNPTTGELKPEQIANDVIVTVEGNMGVGTITPNNKLVIDNGAKLDTGLRLKSGAGPGGVLTAKADGSTYWDMTSTQSYNFSTIVVPVGNSQPFYGSPTSWGLFKNFTIILSDNLKNIFGENYGWDITQQRYIAPKSGKYRVTLTGYFNYAYPAGNEWRMIIAKNGEQKPIDGLPYISVIAQANDQNATLTGIVDLKKDDFFDVRVANMTDSSKPVQIYCAGSHTILLIEFIN